MKTTSGCLSLDEVRQFVNGSLTADRIDEVEDHLAVCEFCVHTVEKTAGQDPWWSEVESALRDVIDAEPADGPDAFSDDDVLALLGPTDDPKMIGRIGTYEILGILGRGGMGVVFKAFDAGLNRFVAIKILLPQLAAIGTARARFRREGQAAAAVVDEHVLPIYAVDEWRNVPYLVMRYVRGSTVERRLKEQGPLKLREILRIGLHAARGLAAAHAQGLVHRDIKPSNILLEGAVDRAILSDFGLARAVDDASLTRSGFLAGTPLYMSPEQVRGETIDQRSDIFSLGSVLYALCTGHPPFRAETSYAVMRRITDETPRPVQDTSPDLPEWLDSLIAWLMAKDPDDRPQTAMAVEKMLRQCLAHVERPYAVPLPREFARFRSFADMSRIRSLAMMGLAAAVLGLVVRTGVNALQSEPVTPAPIVREAAPVQAAVAVVRPPVQAAPVDPPAQAVAVRTEPVRSPASEIEPAPKADVKVAMLEPKPRAEPEPVPEPEPAAEPAPQPALQGETVAGGYRIRLAGVRDLTGMRPVMRIDPRAQMEQMKPRTMRKNDMPAAPNRANPDTTFRQFGPTGQSFGHSFSNGASFGQSFSGGESFGQSFSGGNAFGQSFSSGNAFGQTFSGGDAFGTIGSGDNPFSQTFSGGDAAGMIAQAENAFGQTFSSGGVFGNAMVGGGGSGGVSGGSFSKPNFGIALEITEDKPARGRNERIVELAADARIVEADGKVQSTPEGPVRFSFPEFEAEFPGTKAIYMFRAAAADEPFRKLEGKLSITQGRKSEVHFKGTKPQSRKDGSSTFVLESVKQTERGFQVVVKFPAPASARRGNMMAVMQAVMAATDSAELAIVDSEGQVHKPTSKAFGATGNSLFRSSTVKGQTNSEFSGTPISSAPAVTFGFEALPEGVTIESIVASIVERSGEPKVVPFTMPVETK